MEWTTYSGNTLHAVRNHYNPQCKPVKCLETGKVFASLGEAEREYNLTSGRMSSILKSGGKLNDLTFVRYDM